MHLTLLLERMPKSKSNRQVEALGKFTVLCSVEQNSLSHSFPHQESKWVLANSTLEITLCCTFNPFSASTWKYIYSVKNLN